MHPNPSSPIFVFGSNLKGIHGAGAALHAKRRWGAKQGQGEGLQGQSYALPTKRTPWARMTLLEVETHVAKFLRFARSQPALRFQVTAVGTGRAGFTVAEIAPMFDAAPPNCDLCAEFSSHLAIAATDGAP